MPRPNLRVVGRLDAATQRAIESTSTHSDQDYDFEESGALFDGLRKWEDHELSDNVRLRLRKGHRLKVTNIGTEANPKWTLEPVAAGALDATGVLPLIPLAVKAGMSAVVRRGEKAIKRTVRKLKPGESTQLGALFVDTDGLRVQDGDDF